MTVLESTERVPLTRVCGAQEFTREVLSSTPGWLFQALDLRDRIVRRFGFATQPADAREIHLYPGGTAGPFVFTAVTDEQVEAGNGDRHFSFVTRFYVEDGPHGPQGCLNTRAVSRSGPGAVYLRCIWPFHRLLMGRILRVDAGDSDLRKA